MFRVYQSVCPIFSVNDGSNEWFEISGFKIVGFCDVIANHCLCLTAYSSRMRLSFFFFSSPLSCSFG